MKLFKRKIYNDLSIILFVIAIIVQFMVKGQVKQNSGNMAKLTAINKMLFSDFSIAQVAANTFAVLGLIFRIFSLYGKERAMHTLPVILFLFYIGTVVSG